MNATTDKPTTIEDFASLLVTPEEQPQEVVEEQDEDPAEAEAQAAADEPVADEAEADDADDIGEDDETDAEAAEEKQDLIPVKIDGKIEMWTLDQLKQSAAGQGYIQKQMRENAEAKKQVTQIYQQMQQERQALAQMYQQLSSGQVPATMPQPPSRDLMQSDPIAYMEARAKYDDDLAAYQQAATQMQQLQQQQAELNNRARQAYIAEQMQLLQQAIPEFADKKTGTALRDQIIRTASDVYGYDPQELQGVADHRHVRVLRDAMLYRQMMAERSGVEQQKVSKARPVVKPGAQVKQDPTRNAKRRQMATAKKTGKVEDFVDLLFT